MQHRFNISHPSNKFGFTGAEIAMLWETVYQVTSRIELGLHISQCHIPTVFNTLSGASTDIAMKLSVEIPWQQSVSVYKSPNDNAGILCTPLVS